MCYICLVVINFGIRQTGTLREFRIYFMISNIYTEQLAKSWIF